MKNQYIETTLGIIKGTEDNTPTTVIVEGNSVEVHVGEESPKHYELVNGSLVDELGYGWTDLEKFIEL